LARIWIDARGSNARLGEHIEDAVSGGRWCKPNHGTAGLDAPVEVEDKPVSRKEKREVGSKRVRRVVGDCEYDGERTYDGTLEADPQQEPPLRVTTTWGESRPATGGADDAVVLHNPREIEHVGPSAGVDPERHREPILWVTVKDRH
jgi:hypothetical protein